MRKIVLSSLAALALAACGQGQDGAFLDTRTPPSLGPRFWAPDGWAWGVIEIKGAPDVRYGVAAPAQRALTRDTAIIVADYGEPAEAYFEAVRAMNARGVTVWVLELHGQGGSARFAGPRDIGRSAGFDKDALALRWLIDNVIRPRENENVALAAHGSAVLPVTLALESGLRRIQRVYFWAPDLEPDPMVDTAMRMTQVGLGWMRARGGGWKRPTGKITDRDATAVAWQLANPDLRMGGPAWSWIAAEAAAIGQVTDPARTGRITVPIVMDAAPSNRAAVAFCSRVESCTLADPPSGEPFSTQAAFDVWLNRIAPEPVEAPAQDDPASDHAQ